MLTIQQLKDMPAQTVFACGEFEDVTSGINITGQKGLRLRWMAVRGGYHDWTIYLHHAWQSWDWILAHGDKPITEAYIRKLVPCDDEAYGMFRR